MAQSQRHLRSGDKPFCYFFVKNDQGTQVFTKNGWYDKWTISYERNLPSSYGNQKGINGGSSIYTLKK
ncbi:hypothetical protein [Flavobacterium defluvii]|uniref:hypothetical protein n=1 Tax=Flavobacterium defluvii TaxID=370979 RepID=UPI0009330D4C|nr:hypothetical protein [Flavobacterium defluvii]